MAMDWSTVSCGNHHGVCFSLRSLQKYWLISGAKIWEQLLCSELCGTSYEHTKLSTFDKNIDRKEKELCARNYLIIFVG